MGRWGGQVGGVGRWDGEGVPTPTRPPALFPQHYTQGRTPAKAGKVDEHVGEGVGGGCLCCGAVLGDGHLVLPKKQLLKAAGRGARRDDARHRGRLPAC